jgi:hypothetical protein
MSFYSKFKQDVAASTLNSSNQNLDAGATWTGSSESTLGIVGIQISMKTDQNCTVYVDQSPDGTNWDVVDSYNYYVGKNFGLTVQAVNSYFRVRVTNLNASTATTYFRFQTALCPIVESVPRSLSPEGRLLTATGLLDLYGFHAENTPMGEMRVATPVRLVGTSFEGSTIDANFWTTAASGTSASIAQASSQILLTSGTSNAATVTAFSARRARYVGGAGMRYRAVVQPGDTGTANNTRRWGIAWGSVAMPAVTDGAWFQISGTTFSVVTMKGGSAATVNNGSFNGNYGTTYDLSATAKTYEIYWTNTRVIFVVGDVIVHTVSAATATWSNTMSPHVFMDSVNSGVLGASVTLAVRTATIYRLGNIETSPIWKHLTAATATILKYGAGRLHSVTYNTFGNGATVSIYDALTATNAIALMAPPNNIYPGTVNYDLDFYIGLTITITGTVDLTIVYE